MSVAIPIDRVPAGGPGTPDWWAQVVVFDDPTFPFAGVVRALVAVLEVTAEHALQLVEQIEKNGKHPVWEGTREGADHTARRLRKRGLRARVQ